MPSFTVMCSMSSKGRRPAALLGLLLLGLAGPAGAQVAPKAPATASTTATVPAATAPAPTSTATATVTIVKLKLDAVTELKASRGQLETTYSGVKLSGKGKAEWREGVILLAAGDAARKAGDAVAYKKLATEATTRFDLAKTLSAGGTGKAAGLTALKADALLGKYVTPAEGVVPAVDTLLGTATAWTINGFEPETF
ncbi:hypothetical protein L6V77_08985 [Myxococcota bacterium]|nr:hypothetical protein [Myxococcota bacterium]